VLVELVSGSFVERWHDADYQYPVVFQVGETALEGHECGLMGLALLLLLIAAVLFLLLLLEIHSLLNLLSPLEYNMGRDKNWDRLSQRQQILI